MCYTRNCRSLFILLGYTSHRPVHSLALCRPVEILIVTSFIKHKRLQVRILRRLLIFIIGNHKWEHLAWHILGGPLFSRVPRVVQLRVPGRVLYVRKAKILRTFLYAIIKTNQLKLQGKFNIKSVYRWFEVFKSRSICDPLCFPYKWGFCVRVY